MKSMAPGTRFTLYGVYGDGNGRIVGAAQVREKCAEASIIISDERTGDSWPDTVKGARAAGAWSGDMNATEARRVYGDGYAQDGGL